MMRYPAIKRSPKQMLHDAPVRRHARSLSVVMFALALLLPAVVHADAPIIVMTPAGLHVSLPTLSTDELSATAARGAPPNSPSRILAPAPIVRLWDEIGTPQALPNQGTVNVTTSASHAAP